jgi:Immunity protein 27
MSLSPLQPNETDLVGQWVVVGKRVVDGDPTEKRIGELIDRYLQKVTISAESGGWDILYLDPADGRYWELTYPRSEMHGGGPRRLTNLSIAAATAKYQLPPAR